MYIPEMKSSVIARFLVAYPSTVKEKSRYSAESCDRLNWTFVLKVKIGPSIGVSVILVHMAYATENTVMLVHIEAFQNRSIVSLSLIIPVKIGPIVPQERMSVSIGV